MSKKSIKALRDGLVDETRYVATCAVCEKIETDEEHTAEHFAERLDRDGWVYKNLEIIEGLFCPFCAKQSEAACVKIMEG